MSLILADLIRETTTTTGTGDLTLGGATTGNRAFSAVCANGDTVPYAIGDPGDAQREVGLGTWHTGNTLTRTSIFASSNGGAAVNLSAGSKPVYLTLPAEVVGLSRSGAIVPTVAMEGATFLHTPTGRTVLLRYAGGAWRSVASYGSMTLYVDGASGSDNINKGYGTGANAYATVQYAINAIPASVGGNVAVNVAAGTFAEDVSIAGKTFAGNYTITITGTRSTLDTLTSSASTQGSGAIQGTVVRSSGTWTSNQRQNKMVRFTAGVNSGVTRIIDSNTTTTITIVEVWSGGAPGTDAFVVEDWGTTIRSVAVGTNQIGVVLVDVSLVGTAGSAALTVPPGARVALTTTKVSVAAGSTTFGVITVAGGSISFDTCVLTNATDGDRILAVEISGLVLFNRTKLVSNDASTTYGIILDLGGVLELESGNVVDANGGDRGIEVRGNSSLLGLTLNSHNRIRNAVTAGIRAYPGSSTASITSGTYVEYSGNGTNILANTTFFDAHLPAAFTLTNGAFTKITGFTVDTDLGSNWNAANQWYVVPVSGIYLIRTLFRLTDSVLGNTSYGHGVNTALGDFPGFLWADSSNSAAARNGSINVRMAHFNAGDTLFVEGYWDSVASVLVSNCGFNISLVEADR